MNQQLICFLCTTNNSITIFIDFFNFQKLCQIIRCLIVVNELNVMSTSLIYKNRETQI